MASARVVSCFGYLPAKVVLNSELCKRVETSEEWIVSRTGILQRHIASEEERTSDLALKAARGALKNAGVDSVDLVMVATTTPDKTFPSVAATVQSALSMGGQIPAFDLQAVCAGFVYGLEIANCLILSKKYQSILLIGADKMSSVVDWKDRSTCVLFGDGAGAVVLQSSQDQSGIIDSLICSDGSFANVLYTNGGPSSSEKVGKIFMDGQTVFKHAVLKMSQVVKDLLCRNGIKKSQISCFIPHQANKRITDSIRKELDLSEDQVISTVDIHANCSAGSIPLALHHACKLNKIQKGDIVVLAAFGGGFTWGASLIRW
jgi:3-oxoacyl-[acyl-carrier-protein] synthase-3